MGLFLWVIVMRGSNNIMLKQLDGMTTQELITFVESVGFCAEALSNDELYELAVSILDGHEDEGEPQELSF